MRKPLTPEQRVAKNARDKLRRSEAKLKANAPAKAKVVAAKAKTVPAKKKSVSTKKGTPRKKMFGDKTMYMDIVRFIRRPQGATHTEIVKKFNLKPADERGRFWHIRNSFGIPIQKNKLPKGSKRVGNKVFTLPKGA
jgi:hypothetical protein